MRIPSAHEIASGKLKINNLRRISPDDLLGEKQFLQIQNSWAQEHFQR